MIDLEDVLARIVELAPEPPDVAGVTRRAQQRRTRRHGSAIAALLVVVFGIAGAIALRPTDHGTKHVTLAPTVESVNVTLLDGSKMKISGPKSLGLTKLEPVFNAQLDIPTRAYLDGHSFTVQRAVPTGLGEELLHWPTGDGHELVEYSTANGITAVVRYGDWTLVAAHSGHDPTEFSSFATALHARRTADGFLVLTPIELGWVLGPTDAPEVQLGGAAYGSDAAFSFFGPSTYPSGCPTAAEATRQTPEGWPVTDVNGTWWCDPDTRVRIRVGNPALADDAIEGLRVTYTAAPTVPDVTEHITTLAGQSFEITGPAGVLTQFSASSTLVVDGLTTAFPMNVYVERSDDDHLSQTLESNATADGNQLVSVRGVDGEPWLKGTYGKWYLTIMAANLSSEERARVASLFAAHVNADGYLVLDLHEPMHLTDSPVVIGLNGIGVSVSESAIDVTDRGGYPGLLDRVKVRRIG
jgi:hypothetical protein